MPRGPRGGQRPTGGIGAAVMVGNAATSTSSASRNLGQHLADRHLDAARAVMPLPICSRWGAVRSPVNRQF